MIRLLIVPCCLFLGSISFAQSVFTPASAAPPGLNLSPPPALATPYEKPGPLAAADLLSASSLAGPGYRVASKVDPSGMLYSFHIDSDFGPYDPQSLQMMRVRLTELQAMARLKELSEEPLFVQGMGKQLEKTAVATGKAIMSPIQTLKNVPIGFKKFAGDIQAQQSVGTVYGESGAGLYAQVKRELASRLGVDPYTDNQPLQELLNEVAKNQNRGQLVASVGTLVVGGGAGVALGAVEMNDDFQSLIRDKSAAQLQVDNHEALLRIGCSLPAVERFITTPGYTATNCTAIARALVTMRNVKGVCDVVEKLPPFAGPESVLLAQTQIEMAAQFNRGTKPLKSVRYVADTAVWSDADGTSYVFTPLEFLYWNEEVDIGFSNIRREVGAGRLELWISGIATPLAQAELEARGVTVQTNSFSKLWPQAKTAR